MRLSRSACARSRSIATKASSRSSGTCSDSSIRSRCSLARARGCMCSGRFLRRHRWGVAAGCSFVLALATRRVPLSWQAHRVALERDIARRAATREEAVRYHLTRLFRSSVAEHGPEPTTAKAMLDRSAQARAAPVSGRSVSRRQSGGDARRPVRRARRCRRAGAAARRLSRAGRPRGRPGSARAREAEARERRSCCAGTSRARRSCSIRRRPCGGAIRGATRSSGSKGSSVRGRLQRAQGDLDGSIATYQAAIRERVALSGRHHAETATLYNSLAITYTWPTGSTTRSRRIARRSPCIRRSADPTISTR